MGAWGYGSFENDDALDWVGVLIQGNNFDPISNVLNEVLKNEEYLEVSEAAAAIAAAETVAALRRRPSPDLPSNLRDWLVGRAPTNASAVKRAQTALEKLLKDSELKELWEEAGAAKWRRCIRDLQDRLAAVGPPKRIGKAPSSTVPGKKPKIEPQLGDFVSIRLMPGIYALGKVVFLSQKVAGHLALRIFRKAFGDRSVSRRKPKAFLRTVWTYSPYIETNRWAIVGNEPLNAADEESTIYCVGKFVTKGEKRIRRATPEDADNLPGQVISPPNLVEHDLRECLIKDVVLKS